MIPPDKTTKPGQESFSSQAVQTIDQGAKSFKTFLKKVTNDSSLTFSAALAYTLMFSAFPIVLALLSLLGLLLGQFSKTATNTFVQGITHHLPGQLQSIELIKSVSIELQHSSAILALFALLSSLFFGAQAFIMLETCFSIIYRVRPRPLIRQQVVAMAMFFLFLLLVPVMIFAASIPTLALSLVQYTPLGRLPLPSWAMGQVGGWLASLILFESIYVLVPNMHIRLRHAAPGALAATIALQLYLALFPLYATYFLNSLPGVAGLIALLLIFFYYFAVILLLGAEVNAFFVEGVGPMPNDLVAFATTMAGKLNQDIPEREAQMHVDTRPTEQADKEHALDVESETEGDVL